MGLEQLPAFIREHYEVHEWKHAQAILETDFAAEWADILAVLTGFRLKRSWLEIGGGSKSKVSKWIDSELYRRGWTEKGFETQLMVDKTVMESPTHKVDCFKNRVALEIEWNNKDPFYDRDLNNFRLLFDLRAISVGVIVTRCDELQDTVESLGRGASFGASTTHMSKLLPRITGGGGGGCPIIVFGITNKLYLPEE
ncbi:MAG: BglII/BstYI family type II restriction endonuclease [Terriglobia bacterium]